MPYNFLLSPPFPLRSWAPRLLVEQAGLLQDLHRRDRGRDREIDSPVTQGPPKAQTQQFQAGFPFTCNAGHTAGQVASPLRSAFFGKKLALIHPETSGYSFLLKVS